MMELNAAQKEFYKLRDQLECIMESDNLVIKKYTKNNLTVEITPACCGSINFFIHDKQYKIEIFSALKNINEDEFGKHKDTIIAMIDDLKIISQEFNAMLNKFEGE